MVNSKKSRRSTVTVPATETAMDKTTRIAKSMIAADAEQRATKLIRLRNARLKLEASTLEQASGKTPKKPGKSRSSNAVEQEKAPES